jgi:hypothetical protein
MPVSLLKTRAVLVAAMAAGASVVSLSEGSTAADVNELAVELGKASGAVVKPEDIRWETTGGVASDLVLGRFALFLGSATVNGPRDVYRARVRLSPEGRPLSVGAVSNLTSTPIGDDHQLVVSGTRAAYATWAFGQEQSVTALDLAGEGKQNETKKLSDQAMAFVTNVQQTGSGDGIGRIDVTLDQPANRVGLALAVDAKGETLAIDLADDDRARHATRTAKLDLVKGDLVSGNQMHAEGGKHLPKRFVFWAVDTVRAVPWIGPAPIAWLEEKAFAARDGAKQAIFKATGGNEALAKENDQPPPASVLDTSQAQADLGHWPPAPLRSMWKTPEAGEGEWEAPKQPWIKRMAKDVAGDGEAAPSPFMRTFVRPDEERPYAKVLLVAMDMRQLDLDMEAGSEDPKPLTGPPGVGRLPRDPAVYQRVAAAFNGGFKTEHGNYGMMLKKRVLLPPVQGAATVILTKDGRMGMGTWGTNKDVGGIEGVAKDDIVSFRQNLDPLVENDVVNPMGRWQWGFTLPGTSMQTERTGICVTSAGHLVYAWGEDLSATSIGKAMKMAGCVYGMHLDMNPHHTGFTFTNINEFKGRNYKSELLSTQMGIDTDRYLLYAPKDFFFVTMHDPTPPKIEGLEWSPDPGAQPAPSWMAGVWRAKAGGIDVVEVEPARAAFRVRAGTKEPRDARTELDGDDAKRVLFALTLGTSDPKHHKGLVVDGKTAMPLLASEQSGAVVVGEDGAISIARAKDVGTIAPHADVVEMPLLIDEGETVPAPHQGRSRSGFDSALGVTAQGRVFVARATGPASADDLAALLKRSGCVRAVLVDRGAGSHGALFRAGTPTPPRSRYEDTTLYAIARPMLPRGFRFEATSKVEPPKKK